MRLSWQQFFRDHDAFLMPVDFVPAFRQDRSEPNLARFLAAPEGPRRYGDELSWASFAILTGLPTTVALVGATAAGLPVGIQIMGPWLEDAPPTFVVEMLEREFGFRVPKGCE